MKLLLAAILLQAPADASLKGPIRPGPQGSGVHQAAGASPGAAPQGVRLQTPLTPPPSAAPGPAPVPSASERPLPEVRDAETVELPLSVMGALPAAPAEGGTPSAGRESEGRDRKDGGILSKALDPEGPLASAVEDVRDGGSGAGLAAVYEGEDPALRGAQAVLGAVSLRRRWFGRDTLRRDGRRLQTLGQGNFGNVLTDPVEPEVVLKVIQPNMDLFLFSNLTMSEVIKEEEEISRLLSDSGAGPRYFGRRNVGGRMVFAKERVHGESLETIIRDRRFGPEDHRLVMEMLDRMAAYRLIPDDMRPANVLIGHTASDPARRAYLVDAIKEKVDGAVAAGLASRGRLGPEDRRLIDELLREAGEPPLAESDPRAERIAVGVTQKNSRERRAYFVDERLNRDVLFPYLTLDQAREALRRNAVIVKVIGNPMAGTQEALHQPFEQILEEGLARAKRTKWWQRLLDALAEAFANAQFPAK